MVAHYIRSVSTGDYLVSFDGITPKMSTSIGDAARFTMADANKMVRSIRSVGFTVYIEDVEEGGES